MDELRAYNEAAETLDAIMDHLVEYTKEKRTPKEIHNVLELLRDSIHPHMEVRNVWQRAYHKMQEHKEQLHSHTASWVIAYLREQSDFANQSFA